MRTYEGSAGMGRRNGGAGQGRVGCGCTAGRFHSIMCVHHLLISTVSPEKQAVDRGCCEDLYGLSTAVVAMGGYEFQ